MAVDLGDLVEALQNEVSPPGTNLYPNAVDDEWIGRLKNAFWEGRLRGMLVGFRVDDTDQIVPVGDGDPDLGEELQQFVVLYAAYKVTLTNFTNLKASFKAQAGPLSFEQQQSATLLKGVLDAIKESIDSILDNLSTQGAAASVVAVFDRVIDRTYGIACGDQWWVRG